MHTHVLFLPTHFHIHTSLARLFANLFYSLFFHSFYSGAASIWTSVSDYLRLASHVTPPSMWRSSAHISHLHLTSFICFSYRFQEFLLHLEWRKKGKTTRDHHQSRSATQSRSQNQNRNHENIGSFNQEHRLLQHRPPRFSTVPLACCPTLRICSRTRNQC